MPPPLVPPPPPPPPPPGQAQGASGGGNGAAAIPVASGSDPGHPGQYHSSMVAHSYQGPLPSQPPNAHQVK